MSPQHKQLQDRIRAYVGQTLGGRYRLDALLGMGAAGGVFRGMHTALQRPVAVKILHPHLSRTDRFVQRFEREALAASRLDHPNCVRVIECGVTDHDVRYLVMEFIEGAELRAHLWSRLPAAQVVSIAVQIFRGLEHAHGRGLIHRDLKPENVLLVPGQDGHPQVKLVDFGLAKLTDPDPGVPLTEAGLVFGTPWYMSPEQALGDPVGEAADLYAAGVILYEMLAGSVPFDALNAVAVMHLHAAAPVPALPRDVPRELASVVTRLLAKHPEDRYASATVVRRELEGMARRMQQSASWCAWTCGVETDAVFAEDRLARQTTAVQPIVKSA